MDVNDVYSGVVSCGWTLLQLVPCPQQGLFRQVTAQHNHPFSVVVAPTRNHTTKWHQNNKKSIPSRRLHRYVHHRLSRNYSGTLNALASTTRRAMWYALHFTISVDRLIHRRIQWIIVDSRVYDVSKFANLHPGGAAVLLVDSIGNNPSSTMRSQKGDTKQREKMPPKRSSACTGRKCSTVHSTRACRLAPSRARSRKSHRSRRMHFPEYPMRSQPGSRLASLVRITTRATGASRRPCANSSTRSFCPTRSPARTMESVSPSTLWINLRESGEAIAQRLLYYGGICSCAVDTQGYKYHWHASGPWEVSEGQDAPGGCNHPGGV